VPALTRPQGVRLNVVVPASTLTELTAGVGREERSLARYLNRITLAGIPKIMSTRCAEFVG